MEKGAERTQELNDDEESCEILSSVQDMYATYLNSK